MTNLEFYIGKMRKNPDTPSDQFVRVQNVGPIIRKTRLAIKQLCTLTLQLLIVWNLHLMTTFA